jgi:conjugative transposon TraN protein
MKKISAVMITIIFIFLITSQAISQNDTTRKTSLIEPLRLAISSNKTTNLVFPFGILSVDRGSNDIIAQKAKGTENILQVKAGNTSFEETNLTVITADGNLYSYILNYTNNPSVLNIRFTATDDNRNGNVTFSSANNEALLKHNARKIKNKKRWLYGVFNRSYGIKLDLTGIYIKDDVMYYQLKLENNSNVRYNIDQTRFSIRDQQKSKRTASQEIEVTPQYAENNPSVLMDNSETVFVFAVPKFTLGDKKYLDIQVMEKNGSRHLELKVKNRHLLKTRLIH